MYMQSCNFSINTIYDLETQKKPLNAAYMNHCFD